jgi:ankyrin repeat protein
MKAADRNYTEVMRQLVAKGADLSLQDSAGATALMWAAHRGYSEAVELLLSAGADVNVKNKGWLYGFNDCSI